MEANWLNANPKDPPVATGGVGDYRRGLSVLKRSPQPNKQGLRRCWVLWVAVTAAAIWGAAEISFDQWQRYQDNPTVITLEKGFRTWQYKLPAITNCDANRVSQAKLPKVISSRWGVKPGEPRYSYYESFVKTVANSDLLHLGGYQEFSADDTLNVNLYDLVVEVMPEFQTKATWSHVQPPRWFPVLTEAGVCYVTNSLAIADVAITNLSANDTSSFPVSCQASSQSCSVMLEVIANSTFYVHSPYDVADITGLKSQVFMSLNRVTELSVMETGCGEGVRELEPRRRGCLFVDEPVEEARQLGMRVYSTNTCRLTCRARLAIKLCGCKPFYYIYEEGPTCSPAGMHCLSRHTQLLITNGGVKCVCSAQCIEATISELTTVDEMWPMGPFASRGAVRFTVQAPRTRYTREIVFSFQDLVVSFGGAAGLFLGASFISFVEVLYFLAERLLGCGATNNPVK
ncbi:hypothetical protein ACJJTC_002604, partial [Scirpophaga incertulas]